MASPTTPAAATAHIHHHNQALQPQSPQLPPPPTPTLSQATNHLRRQSTATTAGRSDHDGSSEDDVKRDRNQANGDDDEQARKRRRVDGISSCETCKQRKVKCDRSQPSCGWCSRNGQECIYRQKKKPGLRAGIGRELEERLDRVEAMLMTHSRLLEAHLQSTANQNAVPNSIAPPAAVNHFPSPSTASTHSPPTPFTPASDVASRQMADLSTSRSFDADLPTDDILCTLIDLFFQHIHPTCPILHRQTLLDAFFQRRPAEVEQSNVILMHAIVAASLRFSNDPRLSESWKTHFREVAKQKVIINALEKPSVESLRAIVIMVLDVVGSTNGPSGWGLLALTTRMALHLGLALEPAKEATTPQISTMGVRALPESSDWIEEEGRRRLFWVIYVLDVITSLGTSLDLTLDESEIERQLPCRDNLWDRNQHTITRWFQSPHAKKQITQTVNNVESLSAFSYQIEVIGILGRIHRFLRETVDINVLSDVEAWQLKYRTLDKALTSWKYSLPMSYGNLTRALNTNGGGVDPSWVMLHAYYNTAIIRLHSAAAYPTTRSSIFGPSYSASQRCLSAVENISAITRLVLSQNILPLLGPTFAFIIWVATRLLLVHASTTESGEIPDVRLFLDALREAGKLWEVAGRYNGIIERVIDELVMGGHKSEGADRSCVEILSDMRMTAYSVDVMISRQPDMRKPPAHVLQTPLMPVEMQPQGELQGDLLDVFSWFNFPRVPGEALGREGVGNGWAGAATEDADWLFQVV
ncbi:putative C6 transcription factor [Sphaerosporella brunnea]|uniref:Putative C6 transcription factor n=1 Tax=Sphaerosporella brunnea TaxID=1250544 RepID=A0A5J5EL33_9PEZI|nr:putative C6 transcription factor [Sphaerosporella brunnea]